MQDIVLDYYTRTDYKAKAECMLRHQHKVDRRAHIRIYIKELECDKYEYHDLEALMGYLVNHEALHYAVDNFEYCGPKLHFAMACGADECFGRSYAKYKEIKEEYPKAVEFFTNTSQ